MADEEPGQSAEKSEPSSKLVTGHKPENVGMPGTGAEAGFFRIRPWMRSDLLHQWIQSAGILVASAWGIYTFVWQDILVPSWAPAHINLDISLTPVEGRGNIENGSEMILRMSATNPSSRKLYLLSNTWQLFGIKRKAATEAKFITLANQALQGQALIHSERFVNSEAGPSLAVGRIFDDYIIYPGETIDRSVMVRIPADYQAAEVNLLLPALTKEPSQQLLSGCSLVWQMTGEEDLVPKLVQHSNAEHIGTVRRNADCKNDSEFDLDATLRKFDPLMRVFSASKQFGNPVESSELVKPDKSSNHN